MGHADGEVAWTRAAGNEGTVYMFPNLNSRGFDTIVNARTHPKQPLWFQIYVNPDRDLVLDQLKACADAGVEALCITVDSAVAGKRERDLRNKIRKELQVCNIVPFASCFFMSCSKQCMYVWMYVLCTCGCTTVCCSIP